MAIDEFYAAATAADVLRSQKELARQGYSAGGRPPVGYRRAPEVIGTKYGGAPLIRVRLEPDPEKAPRVVQAFQMAADGATYDEILAATGICRNKSSLATILSNPIYRGLRVFNRETRVEGEHGRKRRKNRPEEQITSSVEAVIPDALWARVEARLAQYRENRLPPQRYRGGYVLTDTLRCQCGAKMTGHTAGPRRYYRCTAKPKCGRSVVPAEDLEAGVMDLIRRELLTEDAVRSIVASMNESIAERAESRGSTVAAAKADVRRLEREEANVRDGLRHAKGSTMAAVMAELELAGNQLVAARTRMAESSELERPVILSDKMVQETLAQFTTILGGANFTERVAWVRSKFDYIEVFADHAEAHWRQEEESASGVIRSRDVTEWLRR
jgi:site-specific DNA recombinase